MALTRQQQEFLLQALIEDTQAARDQQGVQLVQKLYGLVHEDAAARRAEFTRVVQARRTKVQLALDTLQTRVAQEQTQLEAALAELDALLVALNT